MATPAQRARIMALTTSAVDVSRPTKKRPRHKKKKKQEEEEKRSDDREDATTEIAARPGKKAQRRMRYQKQHLSPTEFLLVAAQNAQFTGSVQLLHQQDGRFLNKLREKLPSESEAGSSRSDSTSLHVRIETRGELPSPLHVSSSLQVEESVQDSVIRIQPLLVLDLNGILCHRVRKERLPQLFPNLDWTNKAMTIEALLEKAYRPSVTQVASTPIIPRPDLSPFLQYLAQHFCLAIWTSAKSKTANKLIKELIPENIANRLLFVWAQHHCIVKISTEHDGVATEVAAAASSSEEEQSDGEGNGIGKATRSTSEKHGSTTIFEKDLSRVWEEFPLWNQHNTILLDDSPNKCAQWEDNAIHPPALNGRLLSENDSRGHDVDNGDLLDDAINCRRQRAFFEQLIQHWKQHSAVQTWSMEEGESDSKPAVDTTRAQLDFLQQHARYHHMGW